MTDNNEPMVRADGTYPTAKLRQDVITAAVVQTRVKGVDGANPGPDLRRNLDYFLECIDIAQGYGGRSDLLLFHEFPITGFSEWTRDQHHRIAIEVPGPEIEEVAKKARQYNCYIVFGTYAKDEKDWPGHILHLMVMVSPMARSRSTGSNATCAACFPAPSSTPPSSTTSTTASSRCTASMR